MEQETSKIDIVTDHETSTKPKDEMPLYAKIIPANTRKFRFQKQIQQQKLLQRQEQTEKTQSDQSQQMSPCSIYQQMSRENRTFDSHDEKIIKNENNYGSVPGESDDDESVELWSNEIPVYVKGEQRWISGVTEQTTCLDVIEALLVDEGIIKCTNENNNSSGKGNLYPAIVNDYVITERWRRMEQALDGRTKIFKIWNAWGTEQTEVRFSLKRCSDSHHSSDTQQQQQVTSQNQTNTASRVILTADRDSGRGSPTGSINSAIVRRRRHRASRSTFAWMTRGQTIHPKSPKNNIERLMKLILEQGEVIQQQLVKLRDRELEISTIEEERHKVREKEHGKNYLLETYLKGLPRDIEEKQELAAGNSDSGVHTEETAASPDVHHEDQISDTLIPLNEEHTSSVRVFSMSKCHRRSKREHELMLEHQSTKEYSDAINCERNVFDKHDRKDTKVRIKKEKHEKPMNNEVATQIDILEKLIILNKHLQREEELCVRLNAKIKRYEADASGLSESQIRESLKRVSEQLEEKKFEIAEMEGKIKISDDALSTKTDALKKLYDDLEEAEVENRKYDSGDEKKVDNTPEMHPNETLCKDNEELNMSREYLAENIYNISKIILKNNQFPTTLNKNNHPMNMSHHFTSSTASKINSSLPMLNQNLFHMTQQTKLSDGKRIIRAQIHSIPIDTRNERGHLDGSYQLTNSDAPQLQSSTQQQSQHFVDSSMSYLETINQRIQKNNHNIESDINSANNPIIQANQYKLSPKKLLINTQVNNESSCTNNNCTSIMESRNNIYKHSIILKPNNYINTTMQQDVSQLGTLV